MEKNACDAETFIHKRSLAFITKIFVFQKCFKKKDDSK